MLVSHILKRKGSKVVTVDPSETAIGLARLFRLNNIAAAVVVDGADMVAGIVSERDIVDRIAVHGDKALRMQVRDLMTSPPLVCKPDDSVQHAMAVMTDRRVRHLPVMQDGELHGIVSIGDVVKSHLDETRLEVNVLRDYARVHAI
ncbi:MAG: CBS domain-containing protein [Alphaproteobacteria bacterium]